MTKELPIFSSSRNWSEDVLGQKLYLVEKVDKGGNNRIYKIAIDPEHNFTLKEYFTDDRERMDREYKSLEFLEKQGFECLPRVVAKNNILNCALYTFVNGEERKPEEFNNENVTQIVEFVNSLQRIKSNESKQIFKPAVLSTHSFSEFANTVRFRVNKFLSYIESSDATSISVELSTNISPQKLIFEKLDKLSTQNSSNFNEKIQEEDMRLSPVDFGPHNMLFDRNIVNYLDFEYFGWDDPVKIIPNLIFHEGSVGLSNDVCKKILNYYTSTTTLHNQVIRRLPIALSLAGLDWLSILLWSLTSEKIASRRFANAELDIEKYQSDQIAKIMKRLEKIDSLGLL